MTEQPVSEHVWTGHWPTTLAWLDSLHPSGHWPVPMFTRPPTCVVDGQLHVCAPEGHGADCQLIPVGGTVSYDGRTFHADASDQAA